MLASKPTSGLSFVAIIVRDVSRRNCVAGLGASPGSQSGSRSYRISSKRLAGLLPAPRPRIVSAGSIVAWPYSELTYRTRPAKRRQAFAIVRIDDSIDGVGISFALQPALALPGTLRCCDAITLHLVSAGVSGDLLVARRQLTAGIIRSAGAT